MPPPCTHPGCPTPTSHGVEDCWTARPHMKAEIEAKVRARRSAKSRRDAEEGGGEVVGKHKMTDSQRMLL
jgi:hypothetical protein